MQAAHTFTLHIGVNAVDPMVYGDECRLPGCRKDAAAHALLANRYMASECAVLYDDRATFPRVKAISDQYAKWCDSGDRVIWTYSGHGTQFPDTSGDEKDRKDEAWCLFDGPMLDDAFYRLLSSYRRGVEVYLINDSCHSGTAFRMLGPKGNQHALPTRVLPPKARAVLLKRPTFLKVPRTPKGKSKDAKADVVCSYIGMSACRDDQVATDTGENGAFTSAFLSAHDGVKSWRELVKAINEQTGVAYDQEPQLSYLNVTASRLSSPAFTMSG